MIIRIFHHLFSGHLRMLKLFPKKVLLEIGRLVKECEKKHGAQIVVTIEARISLLRIIRGVTATMRAEEEFAKQHVWDTELNNGLLIYLLLADRTVVILADRGVRQIPGSTEEMRKVTDAIGRCIHSKNVTAGIASALDELSLFLTKSYAPDKKIKNELSDEVIIV